jgi:hypothetical protein
MNFITSSSKTLTGAVSGAASVIPGVTAEDKKENGGETELTDQNANQKNQGGSSNKKDDREEPEVGNMKRGDYMIHILIERVKDIKIPPGNQTVDPMIEITCLNHKQYSSCKDDIGGSIEIVYNEHIFLEPRNIEKKEAEEAKICLKLMDKGYIKNSMIGMFEFDLSYIYFMNDHMLLHQWLAISNPNSDNYSEITGYLKVSISVVASGDEQL